MTHWGTVSGLTFANPAMPVQARDPVKMPPNRSIAAGGLTAPRGRADGPQVA
jgi:hypothetical protein